MVLVPGEIVDEELPGAYVGSVKAVLSVKLWLRVVGFVLSEVVKLVKLVEEGGIDVETMELVVELEALELVGKEEVWVLLPEVTVVPEVVELPVDADGAGVVPLSHCE